MPCLLCRSAMQSPFSVAGSREASRRTRYGGRTESRRSAADLRHARWTQKIREDERFVYQDLKGWNSTCLEGRTSTYAAIISRGIRSCPMRKCSSDRPAERIPDYSREQFIEDLLSEHEIEIRRCLKKGAHKRGHWAILANRILSRLVPSALLGRNRPYPPMS
jgi:hypothetical protein